MDRAYSQINRILEEAAHIVRREKETTGALGPAESYKGRQIAKLIEFANAESLWVDIHKLKVKFLSKGGENEVFASDDNIVVKLNNFEYAREDLENFFIRIDAHNNLFGNACYEMIGFAYNSNNEFCAVLTQPYILAKREATEDEIIEYMQSLGFTMEYVDKFYNDKYKVFDAAPDNVLYGIDDDLYFIDTQIRIVDSNNFS